MEVVCGCKLSLGFELGIGFHFLISFSFYFHFHFFELLSLVSFLLLFLPSHLLWY